MFSIFRMPPLVRQFFAFDRKPAFLLESKNYFMTAIDKIIQRLETMSNGQGLLGDYLISDSSGLVVSTAKEVADTVGVSESTVVRFAKELGYRGFPDLKRNLRKNSVHGCEPR
jgi:DNA-binding MurR/RpiR family transcriptional regulator